MSMFSKVKHGQQEYQVKCWDVSCNYDVGDKVPGLWGLSTYGVVTEEGPVLIVMCDTFTAITNLRMVPACLTLFDKWGGRYASE